LFWIAVVGNTVRLIMSIEFEEEVCDEKVWDAAKKCYALL